MRISYIQTSLHWEEPQANLAMLSAKIAPLAGHTDLIILPEMFTTGFSMNAATLAEAPDGPTFQWMMQEAASTGAVITGSFICREGDAFFNRLIWAQPDGNFQKYDKRHLFSLAEEHLTYTRGTEQPIFEWKGWRIRPLICYDLRFPVWSRQPTDPAQRYDLLIYVANWPQRRIHHWKTLLAARAIENQCFTVGVNIVGEDGNGFEYSGDSSIFDYTGQALSVASFTEQTVTVELQQVAQNTFRKQLFFLNDADDFQLGTMKQ
jgi:predicted amidohydrolase